MHLDPDIRAFYDRGREADRLLGGFPSGPLELERTKELIDRHLPDGRLRILDVGGGPGVYATWLMGRGHAVRLVEPVPLHVEQATAAGVDAELGDARSLTQPDASADVVLLLGPLYHLLDASDRDLALREAHRVLRPGGRLFAAAISRFAALLDMLVRLDILDDGVLHIVAEAVETGAFRGGGKAFTNAYFHLPSELAREVEAAGFDDAEVFSIEGPGFLVQNFEERWADPSRREILLVAARLVETEPEMLGAASHLLAVATKPESER
jgi:SAM-dependent methyltransferase